MSSALAIAGVTAALKDLLNDGLLNHDLSKVGSFTVTAMPPDRISTTPTEPNQLNLFLFHLSPNAGWRNAGLPGRDSSGVRTGNPPLALDLHYLLSAYGSDDFNAEILLGYAMQLLHNNPVLTRAQLRTVLGGVSPLDGSILPSPFGNLSAQDLADQVELIKITPLFPSPEDLSKMWTAMQARFRLSMAYTVSVVLIQDNKPAKQALPVLQRGKDDQGFDMMAGWPQLDAIRQASYDKFPALVLGAQLLLTGRNLDSGVNLKVQFDHPRANLSRSLTPDGAILPQRLTLTLPDPLTTPAALSDWAIGNWQVSLHSTLASGHDWASAGIAVVLAPQIKLASNTAAAGNFSLTIECRPRILAVQEKSVQLIFGSQTVLPAKITTPADPLKPTTLKFDLKKVKPGNYVVRLRVDGVDSLPVLLSGTPLRPGFDPKQTVSVT